MDPAPLTMAPRRRPSLLLPGLALLALLGAVVWAVLPAPPPPTPAPEPPPTASAAATPETDHLATLRSQTDPARALQMADEGHQQFAGGGHYADREVVAIRSMLRLGQQEEARGRAQRFLRRFPQHPQAALIRRMAGL